MRTLTQLTPHETLKLRDGIKLMQEVGIELTQAQEDLLIMVEASMDDRRIREPRVRVGEIIEKYGKIEHTQLLQKTWRFASAKDIEGIIRDLAGVGVVEEMVEGRKKVYVWKGGIDEGIPRND